jgi:hypothetical protein
MGRAISFFTRPTGRYTLGFQAAGFLIESGIIESTEIIPFTFQILGGPPSMLAVSRTSVRSVILRCHPNHLSPIKSSPADWRPTIPGRTKGHPW